MAPPTAPTRLTVISRTYVVGTQLAIVATATVKEFLTALKLTSAGRAGVEVNTVQSTLMSGHYIAAEPY